MGDGPHILFASTNRGKFVEVSRVGSEFGVQFLFPDDLAAGKYSIPGLPTPVGSPPEIEESGSTYLENAKRKAEAFYAWARVASLADDAGLEVEALSGAPGLHSARYAGPDCVSSQNIEKLLTELEGVSDRAAQFRSVLFFQNDDQKVLTSEAVVEGVILTERRGEGGFGYDSVFYVPSEEKTLAEIKQEGVPFKTHRILALEKIFQAIAV